MSDAQEQKRTADWTELFFDLVFVVVVALSAHLIEADPTVGTVGLFLLLFFPLWWAWVNLMASVNLFGPRVPAMGALLIAAMPGPAAMAIAIAGGIERDAWLYAAGAAWIRIVMLVMWLLARSKGAMVVDAWRPWAYNLGTAAIWLVSIALPSPYRYIIWAVAVGAEVVLLAIRSGFADEVYRRASISHFLERVGLFVVIVVGEAVYLGVTGLAGHPTLSGGAAALFGFIVCALLARSFFRWGAPTAEVGLLEAQRRKSYEVMRDVIMYLPFLLVAALTLIAAAIGIAVAHASTPLTLSVRVLLASGIGGFYLANAIVGARLGRPLARIAILLIPGIGLPVLACLLTGTLAGWVTLALAAVALVVLDVLSKVLGHHSHAPVAVAAH